MKINVYHDEPQIFRVIKEEMESIMKLDGITLVQSNLNLLHRDGTFVLDMAIEIDGKAEDEEEGERAYLKVREGVDRIREYMRRRGMREIEVENYSGGGYIWEGPGSMINVIFTDSYCIIKGGHKPKPTIKFYLN